MKKLLLSALVAGPLAILPAPLWALPSTLPANLTTSSTSITYSGVLDGIAAGALNITAPDKSILTWQTFNVGALDTINYVLPGQTASVLNNVTGGLSTIAGKLESNGNVYLLNPAGIVISQTAQINTGGFYASTVAEPSSFFTTTGTLNFTGSATTDVVVQSDGSAVASIQALGTGNNITLAGRSVLVEGASLFGNVKLQSAAAGKVNLAQTSDTVGRPQAGGAVNINQASGAGGNLTIVSQGGTVSLTGAPVAVSDGSLVPVAGPAVSVNATGGLVIGAGGLGGSGYAPSSNIALSITAPLIRQSLNSTTTASTAVGTTAAGFATTNAQGQITGYSLTTNGVASIGTGYISTVTSAVIGNNVTITVPQVGFATNVTGALSVNTTGTTNGAVTQGVSTDIGLSRLSVTGATTITTGTSATAADVTLSNTALSTLTLPLVGTVSVIEADGFALGNAKVLPNANNAVVLRARAGNISMSGTSKVEIVPSVLVPAPNTLLTANAGGVTYSNIGDLKLTTLSTTTVAAGATALTATGNVTIPNFSSPSLTITTTGGTITTGTLSTSSGAANQVSATLTANGNISVGNVNTSGKIVINSGGTITLGHANNGFMTTGAGLDLKAVGDVTMTNTAALVSSGTDAKIESTTGSVTLTGGFAGGGTIKAANNVTIGAPSATGKPSVAANTNLDTSSILSKVTGGATSNPAGLYTPNSQVPMTVTTTGTAPATTATGYFTTNAAGQVSGTVITEVGAGYTFTNAGTTATNPNVTFTANAAPTNSVVANSALTLTATAGSVAVTNAVVGTGTVTIVSGGALTVPSITAPNVSLESTTGSIGQTALTAITASGNTTLKAGTSVSLDLAGNDFNNVVLTSSPSGVTLRDANTLTLANGTNAAGSVSITSGAGLTGLTVAPIALATPNVAATAGAATVLAGSVTAVALTTTGTGYAANATLPVTFSAPPAQTLAGTVITNVLSTGQNVQGFVLGAVGTTAPAQTAAGLQAVILPSPVGNGFVNGSEVPLTVAVSAGVAPTVVGIANGNGQIGSIRVLTPGSGLVAGTTVTITSTANAPITSVTATGNLVTNAAGQVTGLTVIDGGSGYLGTFSPRVTMPAAPATGVAATITPVLTGTATTSATITAAGGGYITAPVIAATATSPAFTTTLNATGGIATITPIATGGVALGAASTDVIKVAGNLTLTSVGPVGTVPASGTILAANYSELTTVAANVAITGNVSLNTNGANATFGVPTGGFGATPTVTAAIVGGSIGAGTFTVTQNNSINLGATTAGVLKAKSATGDITNSGKLAITGVSEFTANSLFAPGVITLNDATNVFGGAVSIINGKNVSVVGATAVVVGDAVQNGVVSGSISVESAGALSLTTAGNGNLGVVGFKAGGIVTINDGTNTDGLTLQNISNTGTGTVGVTASGPITLGSGIKLASTGLTTITSTGTGASIKDSAPGIGIFGGLTLSSGNDIAITNTSHSIGRVTMTSGTAGVPVAGVGGSTNSSITYQEGGSANLGAITIPVSSTIPGSLSITSTSGSIFQGAGTISVPTTATGNNTVSFSAPRGDVTLDLVGNSIAPAVGLTALGNSTVRQSTAQNLILGNVAVAAGTFTATVNTALTELQQAAGTTVRIFGETTLNTAGKITLDNEGNNFGGLTIASNVGSAAGGAVVLREGGTINLKAVNTGNVATSTLKLTSVGGAILSSATPLAAKAIVVGGPTTLISATDVALNTTDVANNFGGQNITITAPGNVSIQDNQTNTVIAGGSTIGGTLTVKNDNAAGTIKDSPGALKVFGNASFQTNAAGSINISASTATFGAIKFNSGNVSIAEATTLNMAAGSTSAAGSTVSLSSGGDIVTTGLGGGSFGGTLSLNANGNITVSNPIYVAQGLTFRALGAVNLSALSLTGNLANIAPTNLGAASYVAPAP